MNCQHNGCGEEGVLRDGGVFLCDYHDHGHLGPEYSAGWAHGQDEAASIREQLAAVEKERDRARNRADLANVELGEAKAALGHPDADVVENIVGLQEAIDGYSAMCAEQERRAEKAEKERDEARAEAAEERRRAHGLDQTFGERLHGRMIPVLEQIAEARKERDDAMRDLAAVEKERDSEHEALIRAARATVEARQERDAALRQHSVGLEKIREVQAELAHVKMKYDLLEGVGASADAAKKERDAATGALAAARDLLSRLATRPFTIEVLGAEANLSDLARDFLSSPAADLAARHDAEVERRALESLRHVVLVNDLTGHSWVLRQIDDRLAALATPTPEKP